MIYVAAGKDDELVAALNDTVTKFRMSLESDALIYRYKVSVLDDVKTLAENGPLYKAVRKGINLILPISTPDITEKVYVVSKSGPSSLEMIIPQMVMLAENQTKQAVKEALMNLAVYEPESCRRFLEQGEESPFESVPLVFRALTTIFARPHMAGMAMAPAGGLADAISKKTSYKKSREIMGRFVENCNTIKRLERQLEKQTKISDAQMKKLQIARQEFDYAAGLFTTKVYNDFVLMFMKTNNVRLAYDNCLNRDKFALESKIKIFIDKPDGIKIDNKPDPHVENKLKTSGKLRVYLTDGKKIIQVFFHRKPACIIYMMYLIDRKRRKEDIDSFRVSDNRQLFSKLYAQVYQDDEAESTSKEVGYKMSDYYLEIRSALELAASEFGESALPFYVPNAYSHITVLDRNITIPTCFEQLKIM